MAPEVLDKAVGEDQVEVLTAEQLIGTERVALDRGDTREIFSSLVEIDDRDVARPDRRPRPPDSGSAEINHAEFRQVRNVPQYRSPASTPHPFCERVVLADEQPADTHPVLSFPAPARQPVSSGVD